MRKLIYLASIILLFSLGWFSHMIIRGAYSAANHCKNLDQDTEHIQIVPLQPIELQTLKHKVIHDERTYTRDVTDRRYSVWTADQSAATKLLKDFGIVVPHFQLQNDQVLAVFMNDSITHDLTQIVHSMTANDTFADYADSGMEFKLKAAAEGKKYSHVTAVVFSPVGMPSHLGVRDMIQGGISDRQ